MAMEDELCVDTPHDMLCIWSTDHAREEDRCVCTLVATVRADERRVYRSEIIGLIERTR